MTCTTHHHACECREAAFRQLIEWATEACDELAGEIAGRFGDSLNYPSQARRYKRDMSIVYELRAVLESLK